MDETEAQPAAREEESLAAAMLREHAEFVREHGRRLRQELRAFIGGNALRQSAPEMEFDTKRMADERRPSDL
jgi:hypothetical protein